MAKTRNGGFTLVELLVVIVIIAVLGTLSAVIGPKILKRGRQASSITNMRQLNTYLVSYAGENSNRLPAPVRLNDNEQEIYWHMVLQGEVSGKSAETFLDDKWWKQNDSVVINPMVPKAQLNHKNPGYGMNAQLALNMAKLKGDDLALEDAVFTAVNLNNLSDTSRAPIIMPCWTWFYKCDDEDVNNPKWEAFTVSGKMPVLFLDGHTELLSPREYVGKKLNEAPTR